MIQPGGPSRAFPAVIYLVAFVTGAIVMSFEMLGSRYLNPYFGSGIYTWASLISTVLAALCVGYFIGGIAADRYPSAARLGATVLIVTHDTGVAESCARTVTLRDARIAGDVRR